MAFAPNSYLCVVKQARYSTEPERTAAHQGVVAAKPRASRDGKRLSSCGKAPFFRPV